MKRKFISLLFITFSIFPLGIQAQNINPKQEAQAETLRELINITRQIYDAGITGNKDVLNRYLEDSFLETDAYGNLHDKEWNLQNFLARGTKLTYDIAEAQVRDYKDTAVFYYKWVVKMSFDDPSQKPYEAQLRVTDVFIKRNRAWRLIASHRMPLPKKEATKQ